MDALKALAYGVEFFGPDCVRARRLNGANSVWECRSHDSSLGVLKSFPRDNHGWLHFTSEVDFLQGNGESKFLPEVLKVNLEERFMLLAFYEQSPLSEVSLDQILTTLDSELPTLLLPKEFHQDPPGILGWWRKSNSDLGPSQSALLSYVRSQSWFTRCGELLETGWSPDVPIHGDLKLSNIILLRSDFKLLDWELVGLGIRGWDSAGVIQSCISEVVRDSEAAGWVKRNLSSVLQWVQEADEMKRAAVTIRLVQTAIESAQNRVPAPIHAAGLLQMASDVAHADWSRIEQL